MDSMEINKIVGAAVGALLVYLGATFFAELIFFGPESDEEHAYAYAVEVEENAGDAAAPEEVAFADLLAQADPAKGAKTFGKCKACHKLTGADATGPHLNGVVGRPMGAIEGFGYSDAIAGKGEDWTPENLDAFLTKPKAFAPGTKMTFAGLKKPQDRANLVAYLQTFSE